MPPCIASHFLLLLSCYRSVKEQWWEFFFTLVGRYRDMYKVVNEHAENFVGAYKYLTVNR